ncbi:MAG: DUF177 domain-containing protein [Bacteroidota bacterium]
METDRSLKRRYSINVARMKAGPHAEQFEIDPAFFAAFEESEVTEGHLTADLKMDKRGTHLNVLFDIKGEVMLNCDRCGKPYPYQLHTENRIIYAFDDEMKFEGYEVMYVEPHEPQLSIVQELYDFISLGIPMRRVPDEVDSQCCDKKVLKLLGLVDAEEDETSDTTDENTDPRWDALRGLKDKLN